MRKVLLGHVLRSATILGLSLSAFFSCEEPVDLDLVYPKSKLVISSSFFPDEPVVLRVSATRPRGEATTTPITNAKVTLYEGNELAEELTYDNSKENGTSGAYRTRKFVPEVGQLYTVHVSVPGFDPVTAVSSIPEPVEIRSLEVSGLSQVETGDEMVYDYLLKIDYADPEEETNYYDLRVSQLVIPFTIGPGGDTLRSTPYLKSLSSADSPELTGGSVSMLIQDKGNLDFVEFHLQSRLDPRREMLGRIVAELRTVSPEYFFYHRSLVQPGDLGGPGLEEPVIYFNNVASGLGVFAGYNSVHRDVPLPGN